MNRKFCVFSSHCNYKLDSGITYFDLQNKFAMLDPQKSRVSTKKIKTKVSKRKVSKKVASAETEDLCSVDILTPDCLEFISCFLDTKSALSLYQTSKSIHLKLKGCIHFWKHLCKNENFDEYNALKKTDEDDEN